jgi:hypothetical protein
LDSCRLGACGWLAVFDLEFEIFGAEKIVVDGVCVVGLGEVEADDLTGQAVWLLVVHFGRFGYGAYPVSCMMSMKESQEKLKILLGGMRRKVKRS